MFGSLGNLASLFKQAQQMGSRMQEVSAELRQQSATGQAGGGLVSIELNGLQEPLRCRIDPQACPGGDRELLEDLVLAALTDALTKSKALHLETMQRLAGGLSLPGLDAALAQLTGSSGEQPRDPGAG